MTRATNDQLNDYDPQEYLLMLKTPNGPKAYYPFNWRSHEFRLRYPNGIISAEIILMDLERDFVVVRVVAKEDDLGNGTGIGLQSGSLTLLDKVTEHAKAQALADLGIGCPWPVIFADELESADILSAQENTNNQSPEQENGAKRTTEQSNEHKPARTAETVQAWFAKVYQVKPQELEAKWAKFVHGVTGRQLSKGLLTEDELSKLNGVISQGWQRQKSKSGKTAA